MSEMAKIETLLKTKTTEKPDLFGGAAYTVPTQPI